MSRILWTPRGIPQPPDKPEFNRRDFVIQVGRCQNPFCSVRGFPIHCHELTRGKNRKRSMHVRQVILVLCDLCNAGEFSDSRVWPIERQICLKWLVDKFTLQEIVQAVNTILAPKDAKIIPEAISEQACKQYLELLRAA